MKIMQDFKEEIKEAKSIAFTHEDFQEFLPEDAYNAIKEEDKTTNKKFDLIFIAKAKDSKWAQSKLRKVGKIIYINKTKKIAAKNIVNKLGNRVISLKPDAKNFEKEVKVEVTDTEDPKKLSDGDWLEAGGHKIYEKSNDDLYHEDQKIEE